MVWTYWKEIQPWYAFWQDFEGLGKNAQGRPEYRHRETGIVFVKLPGGTFDMGSPETEADRMDDEGPMHKVTLSPFLIAKYELSQAEWKRVMGANPLFRPKFEGDTLPKALAREVFHVRIRSSSSGPQGQQAATEARTTEPQES